MRNVLAIRVVGGLRYYCDKCHHHFGNQDESEKTLLFIEWPYCPQCGSPQQWKQVKVEFATNNVITR